MMLYELSTGNNKHPNFERMGGRGAECLVLRSTQFEGCVSTILSPIVEEITIWKKDNHLSVPIQ